MKSFSFADTSEKGLETIIVEAMQKRGWVAGQSADYDAACGVDIAQLRAWLQATQPAVAAALDMANDSPARRQWLARLQGEISKRGIVDVLRRGVSHRQWQVQLYGATPSPGNSNAKALADANIWSVTRQLHFSAADPNKSLDVALFVNGLPVVTMELKNSLTRQTVADAVAHYRDRKAGEPIFAPGRALVHFAVDDSQVEMCAALAGKSSWFLPFNRGWNDGAGNPVNPKGLKTAYLWEEILTPASLADIIENYAAILKERDEKSGRVKETPVFPRFHQLNAVRALLADASSHGAGRKYLIQHSAGSGKSNSIAWLVHQLIGLRTADENGMESAPFDSVIVVTDRRILDKQLNATIGAFVQVGSTVAHADSAKNLREHLEKGRKIIVTTAQKFPFILEEIGAQKAKRFAIVIDEAHSGQGSRISTAISRVLGAEADFEDEEDALNYLMESRLMAPNASYFAFTATPKNRTLEIFGQPYGGEDGQTKFRPFHVYSMKQAIEEGFILDVLRAYTPVESFYKLVKTVEDDPQFDVKRAQKRLRSYVEADKHAIRVKAEIMVDHFESNVAGAGKIGGQARAMIVCHGIERALDYFMAVRAYLQEIKSPFHAIVAFSGDFPYGGKDETEASLNGFPSNQIADKIAADPYRFLICADKFQTGYDQPLLHTMYVDKPLGGVKAVQTLSRLNRAHPQKHDTFVLDFYNDAETIGAAFSDYYRATILSEATDVNKLHDLKSDLEAFGLFEAEQVEDLVSAYLNGAQRDALDAFTDESVARYLALDEAGQVEFKGSAKAFGRTYEFLASILPYTMVEWEKLSIFLQFLVPKLPAPREEDLSKGILETIDMDSYRAEKQAQLSLKLEDKDAEIAPVPTGGAGCLSEAELEQLSVILNGFNDQFGNVKWGDADRVKQLISTEIPAKIAADAAFQNAALHSDRKTARFEHDKALGRVMVGLLKDDTELFKQFSDNSSFKKWLCDLMFGLTYNAP